MNRQEFLTALRQELRGLPPGEAEEACRFYGEYFDDAGPENEQDVLERLGPPKNAAASIKAEWAYKNSGPSQAPGKKLSALWVCILALFAAPIALPLAIAAAAVVLALLLALAALVVGLGVGALALGVYGAAMVSVGVRALFTSIGTAMVFVGGGLFDLGLGLALGVGVFQLAGVSFSAIIRGVSRLLSRREA